MSTCVIVALPCIVTIDSSLAVHVTITNYSCLLCRELQIATGEWMNQFAKQSDPAYKPLTKVSGDLLSPPLHKLPPAELIRRTLARRSFAGGSNT